jgi:hypothetical protein
MGETFGQTFDGCLGGVVSGIATIMTKQVRSRQEKMLNDERGIGNS